MGLTLQKAYYYYFKDTNDVQHIVEIWKLAIPATVYPVLVKGDESPFSVSMPSLSDKFQPVRGTGCSINMVSATNMQFFGLYTANMKEFQIRHYINGVLNWCGWLDSELYSEPFSEMDNYPVSFSGTDGFALLDRMNYLQDNGDKFTGISTQFDILKFIIQKMDLPFGTLSVYLSTNVTGTTPIAGETALNVTHSVNANFYNEDGEPETLRTVLESILRPYGAFIIQSGGNLYITDVHQLASGSLFQMERYDIQNNFIYLDDTGVDSNVGDLSAIGFASESQTLTVVPGVNKQIIKLSNYRQTDLIDYNAEEDFSGSGVSTTYGAGSYHWIQTLFTNSQKWSKSNGGRFAKLQGVEDTSAADSYLLIEGNYLLSTMSTESFNYTGEVPYIIPAGYKIRITMDGYLHNTANLEDPAYTPSSISAAWLHLEFSIGSKKYCRLDNVGYAGWYDLTDTSKMFLIEFNELPIGHTDIGQSIYGPIEDAWINPGYFNRVDNQVVKLDYCIPIDSGFDGNTFNFKIGSYVAFDMNQAQCNIMDLRLKNIKLTVVDSKGNDIEDLDTEYVGFMNSQYKESGSDITLIQGCNADSFPTSRAGLLKLNAGAYSFIQAWTRAGVSDNIENLLLRSFVGNYEGKTLELSAATNLLTSNVGYLTYASYLAGRFMPVAFSHNYADATSELIVHQINADSLTINKSF